MSLKLQNLFNILCNKMGKCLFFFFSSEKNRVTVMGEIPLLEDNIYKWNGQLK